ncbi:MAG: deoxyribonuclease IV [Candidatus Heimdallarchaeota archaeon]|nr:deoxyribonuclease IV [Candidatus Heimdallarchaeota archaeon]
MKFGVHVSIAGSLSNSIDRALDIGCDTFQIFTRNPRSWAFKEISEEIAISFKKKLNESNISPIFSHMPYLPNISSSEKEIWLKSIDCLKEEVSRCTNLNIPYIITHLGSPKKDPRHVGIENAIKALDLVLEEIDHKCNILIENIAGKKESMGASITDLHYIIENSRFTDKLGLCFDTCHAFASGYDIRKTDVVINIIDEINSYIGLDKLKIIHCNDSKFDLGMGLDRHEHIGLGKIGEIGFINLLIREELRNIPFICETSIDNVRNNKDELKYLRDLLKKIKT